MHGAGFPFVGNPPTAPPVGGLHSTSILNAPNVPAGCGVTIGRRVLALCSRLTWNLIGSARVGQCGFTLNVSSSDAQVSKATGDALPPETGEVNCVNSSHMKASEFSVLPSTA